MTRRIKVRGIRAETLDEDKLALCYWLLAKSAVEEKRRREEQEKKRQRKSGGEAASGR